jgi:site-specific DNA-methyltransferase (adenine-specific)
MWTNRAVKGDNSSMGNTEVKRLHRVTPDELPVDNGSLPLPWRHVLLGDCLDVARPWLDASIDLIYLDPPFFTRRQHVGKSRHVPPENNHIPIKSAETHLSGKISFDDRWLDAHGGMDEYLDWLGQRVSAAKRLLKPNGTLLLHLDWHAVHYAKVLCDSIFGIDRFQNELIWYYQTGGASKGRFSRKHDSILMYSLSDKFYFDGKAVAIPRGKGAMKRAACPTGARIKLTDTHKNPDDVLIVPALNPMARERNGYPTQKPVALLELLIKALCPFDGTVADLFCGSGTTLLAAEKLGRKWIGCDSSPAAVTLAQKRLTNPD